MSTLNNYPGDLARRKGWSIFHEQTGWHYAKGKEEASKPYKDRDTCARAADDQARTE